MINKLRFTIQNATKQSPYPTTFLDMKARKDRRQKTKEEKKKELNLNRNSALISTFSKDAVEDVN